MCKTRKTEPSRRHLFLGQALLGGLFVCAAVSGLMCTQPTALTCATVRLCTGLGYSMVFGTLLVKCVFLISLNGGVYLPAPYQALLLFFTVAIQLAIGIQWLIYSPPQLVSPQVNDNNCCIVHMLPETMTFPITMTVPSACSHFLTMAGTTVHFTRIKNK